MGHHGAIASTTLAIEWDNLRLGILALEWGGADTGNNGNYARANQREGCSGCGARMTELRVKRKTVVKLKNGTNRNISKLVTVVRCLECSQVKNDVDIMHQKPSLSTQGGGVSNKPRYKIILRNFRGLLLPVQSSRPVQREIKVGVLD